MTYNYQARLCLDAGSICGEGPVWDHRSKRLWWVDITRGWFHYLDPKSGDTGHFETPPLVSGIVLAADGGLIVATSAGLHRMDPETGHLRFLHDPEPDVPGNRLNDIKVDPRGRLWVGTMSEGARAPSGALYRYDPEGCRRMADGMTVTNGMGWSPDESVFYLIDSKPAEILAFDADPVTGTIARRRRFLRFDDGKPDGMCVDADGTLWVAICDAGYVAGISPEGRIVARIEVPVQRITSCAFGDDDLRTLYITSGLFGLDQGQMAAYPTSGALFSVRLPVPGVAQVPAGPLGV
ncbi:SMP-30/gluconolactonase/LRE family protein [Shimia biformata]|uniref:SMP-30/gluconolactonase/LRE family protein n=1 Tax=Shimia biformata TaxID=1294299 RepID=UPI001951A660|nr:SMP-30/gluconolactonase/LRE family protein [Shimia biformata]